MLVASQGTAAFIFGLLGLLIGSFLNVVIYRLPKMLERQWQNECARLREEDLKAEETFNLAVPRSRCPSCGHVIQWYENIPVLSYLFLRGKCSACGARISPRYPLVEFAVGLLFFYCARRWGVSPAAFAWAGFGAALLALALIDWDTTLLPDDITLPLMWTGLIASALGWIPTGLATSLWGAIAGYLSLWTVYWVFKLVTGKEGMGYGDFKLFAALGAWFGWPALIPLILIASISGAVVGIAMKLSRSLREGGYIPFGPFLAGAGILAMAMGPASLLHAVGL